jgi:hypothetical protein
VTLPDITYNFHDAGLASLVVGPRREVTLIVGLDDPSHTPHYRVFIRFGGITNFSEVATFLEQVPDPKFPGAYRARIDNLDYDPQEQSTHHNLIFRLELDMIGLVRIRCGSVTAGPAPNLVNQGVVKP